GRLCSNDPVCAQHAPENQHECRFLHGAACHGCLLIAETSCEQHNDYLDRALLVSTVDGNGAEFFRRESVMLSSLHRLSTEDLGQLAGALRAGWVAPPFSSLILRNSVPDALADSVAIDLQTATEAGL